MIVDLEMAARHLSYIDVFKPFQTKFRVLKQLQVESYCVVKLFAEIYQILHISSYPL